MKVRCVSSAFVSAAFLAAFATTCGTAYATSPEENQALVRKAYATMRSGDAQTAVGEYSDAINSDMLEPEMLANALLNRALGYQQLGDHKLALKDYDAALGLKIMAPGLRSTAMYNRGLAHQKLGNLPKAIEDYTASLLLNPEFAQAYYSRANALRDSGQLLFALSDYERAVIYKHPDMAQVHYGSATTYLALKRPLDAKREFGAALEINPDFGQARAQLVLLGDQTAQAKQVDSDPVLTGSVSSFAGDADVSKSKLPKAVEPPELLQAVFAQSDTKTKVVAVKGQKILDRVPVAEEPALDVSEKATDTVEKVVAIEEVPAIPAPIKKKPINPKPEKKIAAVETEEISDVDTASTSSVDEPKQEMKGWTIQISSAASEDAAWTTWKTMQKRFKVLKSVDPHVVKADLGAKGIFYRIRLGSYDEQDDAKSACGKLKAGGVSCYISKVGS
jgi:tetratricopeptide (TPR) repeat protein